MQGTQPTFKRSFIGSPRRCEVREVESEEIGLTDVKVRVKACGVCGSDSQAFSRPDEREMEPWGHEYAGEVIGTGEGVERLGVGQLVVFNPVLPCGRCANCWRGRPGACRSMVAGPFVGGGEIAVMHEKFAVPADGISALEGTLAEPLTVAIDVVEEACLPLGGELVVLGTGPIGLMAIRVAQQQGAGKIYAVDLAASEAKLTLAGEWGADAIVRADAEDVVERIRSESPQGVDSVIVTGPPNILPTAIELCAQGATIAIIGTDWSGRQFVNIDVNAFHLRKVRIQGAYNAPILRMPLAFDLLRKKIIDADQIYTHRFLMAQVPQAFEAVTRERSRLIKAAILMDG